MACTHQTLLITKFRDRFVQRESMHLQVMILKFPCVVQAWASTWIKQLVDVYR